MLVVSTAAAQTLVIVGPQYAPVHPFARSNDINVPAICTLVLRRPRFRTARKWRGSVDPVPDCPVRPRVTVLSAEPLTA